MTDGRTTFAELTALLCRVPGISIDSSDLLPRALSITLVIRQVESVGTVVYCANGANIPVEVFTTAPRTPTEGRADPMHLRYRLLSKVADGGPDAALARFQMFGNFLVWHLHALGSLPITEANRLLTLWGGRRVAA